MDSTLILSKSLFEQSFLYDMIRVIQSIIIDQINPDVLLVEYLQLDPSTIINLLCTDFEKIFARYMNKDYDYGFVIRMGKTKKNPYKNYPIYCWTINGEYFCLYNIDQITSILSISESVDYFTSNKNIEVCEYEGSTTLYKKELDEYKKLNNIKQPIFNQNTKENLLWNFGKQDNPDGVLIRNLERLFTKPTHFRMLLLLMKITKIFNYGMATLAFVPQTEINFTRDLADVRNGTAKKSNTFIQEPTPMMIKVKSTKLDDKISKVSSKY